MSSRRLFFHQQLGLTLPSNPIMLAKPAGITGP
jgi:hypothetical protein